MMEISIINEPNITDVVFISDVHFGVRNGSLEWNNNIKNYFNDFFIPHVKSIQKRGRKVMVVVAGDYFDSRQHIDINVMNTACDVMEELTKVCPVYMLVGNHDIYKNNELDITSLRCLRNIKKVCIIDKISKVVIKNDVKFLFVPWVGEYKKENTIITEHKDSVNFIVMHTEIAGMTYDNNRPIINGVNMDVCGSCKIISGHIHKRQESKKGFYLGSPYPMDRADIGNVKGVYCISINDLGGVDINFTENTYSPRFVKVRFDETENNAFVWQTIVNNNYVDIVFTEKDMEKVNVNKFAETLYEMGAKKIEIIEEKINVVVDTDDPDVQSMNPDDITIENMFTAKVDKMNLENDIFNDLNKLNDYYIKRAQEELGYK